MNVSFNKNTLNKNGKFKNYKDKCACLNLSRFNINYTCFFINLLEIGF